MNSNFSEKQIEAYAAAFEEGDAIWSGGEWKKVTQKHEPTFKDDVLMVDGHVFVIKRIKNGSEKPITRGFLDTVIIGVENQYRVTTLADYELQGGEKLVWLGDRGVMIGEVFETFVDAHGNVVYENEFGRVVKPVHQEWGVIPKYNQVQTVAGSGDETKGIARVLYERYYDVLQNALRNNIKSALQENNYSLVIELSELAIEMEESK